MIEGPGAYTGRRRADVQRQPRIVFVIVLIVVAAVVLALRSLPVRGPGHAGPESYDGPVVPALSGLPEPALAGPSAARPSGSAGGRSAGPSASATLGSASQSAPVPAGSVSATGGPSGSPSGTTAAVLVVEAEAAGNGRPPQMTVRDVAGASGGRAVTGVGNGRSLAFTGVEVPRRGDYKVTISYLSAEERVCYFGGGPRWTPVTFPAGGGLGAVATVTVTLRLEAGRNTVEAGNTTGRWCPDLDRISVALR